jgi:hypothetical protein
MKYIRLWPTRWFIVWENMGNQKRFALMYSFTNPNKSSLCNDITIIGNDGLGFSILTKNAKRLLEKK